MPCEQRLVTFSQREIREALLMLLCANQTEVRNEIVDISLGEGATAIVRYARRPDIKVSQDVLCSALLTYCKAGSIPLPLRGVKSLRREDAAITLVIELVDAPFVVQLHPSAA